MRATWVVLAIVMGALLSAGCQNMEKAPSDDGGGQKKAATRTVKAAESAPETTIPSAGFDKPGFVTLLLDERVWVFREGSPELADFLKGNEPAKSVTMVKAGPGAHTLRAVDKEILKEYLAARDGFVTEVVDGRIWVFRPGSEDLATFRKMGEPAKYVIRPGAGPAGMTVKGPDTATVVEYLTAKPGFDTRYDDGRLWIFRPGSEDLKAYETMGEPAKHVIRPAAGPDRMTLKAPDMELIEQYMAAADGFETDVVDGRIWVFRPGSEDYAVYKKMGEPAKYVIRPKAGPLQMTVKAPDESIISDYLRMTVD
jgi:sugar lactone lactonase YvrE